MASWSLSMLSDLTEWIKSVNEDSSKKAEGDAVSINDLPGVAMGCIQLSFDDFCRLTPEEFDRVYKSYQDRRDADYNYFPRPNREVSMLLFSLGLKPLTTTSSSCRVEIESGTSVCGNP